jgi:hypothetical protein
VEGYSTFPITTPFPELGVGGQGVTKVGVGGRDVTEVGVAGQGVAEDLHPVITKINISPIRNNKYLMQTDRFIIIFPISSNNNC